MKKESPGQDWQVYLLQCADNSLYCGVTNNLAARIETHNQGMGAKYTRSRRPVTCVAQSPMMTKSQAYQLEYRVKKMPTAQKAASVRKGEIITTQ